MNPLEHTHEKPVEETTNENSSPAPDALVPHFVITEAQVREMLKGVEDPELHVDVITLELIYGIKISGGTVEVTMTLTTPACPYGPMLIEAVKQAVKKIPGVKEVTVQVTFEPLWQPSDDLKAMMGLL